MGSTGGSNGNVMTARYRAPEPPHRRLREITERRLRVASVASEADAEPVGHGPRPPIAGQSPAHRTTAVHLREVLFMNRADRRGPRSRLLLLAIAMVVVAACGGASATLSNVGAPIDSSAEVNAQAAATAAPAEAPAADVGRTGEGVLPAGNGGDNPPSAPREDLKIVYTGSLELVVDDLQAALAKARTAVLATGGYIGASQETNDGDNSVAVITYRIPASRWEDGLGSLRGLAAKVVGEQTQATEVGGQIVDLEARIRNLRASEQVLVEIAKGTGKVSDLLEVQDRISAVRGEIEQLEGQHARLADQVAYGTLVTTFGREVVQVQEAKQGWNPASDVDGAAATMIGVGQSIVSGAIWFGIVWLPFLLVLLLVALIARWLYRRLMPPARPIEPVPGWGGEG